MTVQIAGRWVEVNPADWGPRETMSVNVGLGSGTREEARANMMMLASMQEKIAPLGLIGPKQGYNTFKHGAEILGFQNPEQFAMDPDSPEYQQWMAQHPPQPAPEVQAAKIKGQAQVQTAQIKSQTDAQSDATDLMMRSHLGQLELAIKAAVERAKLQLERQKLGAVEEQPQPRSVKRHTMHRDPRTGLVSHIDTEELPVMQPGQLPEGPQV